MNIPDGSASSSSADGSQRVVLASDYAALEKLAQNVVKDKQKFERLEMTKEELLEMFKYNPFKVHFINSRVPDGTKSTVYRCGPMVDLCRGPHIPHTGRVKALSILKVSRGQMRSSPPRTDRPCPAELVVILARQQGQPVAAAHLRCLVPEHGPDEAVQEVPGRGRHP